MRYRSHLAAVVASLVVLGVAAWARDGHSLEFETAAAVVAQLEDVPAGDRSGSVLDAAPIWADIHTLDSEGDVGSLPSIAIGADGLGLISYCEYTGGLPPVPVLDYRLWVAHCNDTACTSATTSGLDSHVGPYSSIAIETDGLGLISYYDGTSGDLKVAHCNDTTCTSATTATLDYEGNAGLYTSIAIGADGRGLISYYDATNDDLKIAHVGGIPEKASDFYTVTPCRLADTRSSHPPALAANTTRNVSVTGHCAIPSTATAVAVNVTVVGANDHGHLRLYPAGTALPDSRRSTSRRG